MPLQVTSNSRVIEKLINYGAQVTADVVFQMVSSKHITDSSASELLSLSSRKETMSWHPEDLNSDGDTALHIAHKLNKPVILDYLVKCDPNANKLIHSLLQLTTNLKVAKILIKHGAKVTPEMVVRFDEMEITPERQSKLIELMLTSWNPDDVNSDGYTALHLACEDGRYATVKRLLSVAHCDPNFKGDVNGYSALHLACKAGNPAIVKHLLCEARCDPNVKSENDKMPIQLTADICTMKTLVEHGAKIPPDVVFMVISSMEQIPEQANYFHSQHEKEQCYGIQMIEIVMATLPFI